MSRIAIILGVANYVRQQALPACQNDADLVRFALNCSKEYEDILFLADTGTNSDEVKHHLTQFVEKHKGRTDLEEVFFFYSGHGQFLDDEFYYILSDFDENRRNRTCLKNSELDGYLRTLGPNLAVKIVDACNAGVQYVKDAGGLAAVIEKGSREQGLKKVYFLFSSLFDQSSFASTAISDYTRSFVEAIYTNGRPEIRYRDIVDQISDDFAGNRDQRPFFVIQADNTEIFGSFSDTDKDAIRARFEAVTATSSAIKADASSPAKQQPTLADLIKEQAKDYLLDDEIVEAIELLPVAAKHLVPPADIRDLFSAVVETAKDFQGLSGLGEIGKWLNENKQEYFARVLTRVEEYQGYENDSFTNVLRNFGVNAGDQPKKVTKTRSVISGYEPMWDKPSFWRIALVLNTKFPNVPTFRLNILYLFSRLDIRLFYSIDEKWPGPGDVAPRPIYGAWKALQLRLRELKGNPEATNTIFADFTNSVTEKLRQIAGVPKDQPGEEMDALGQPELGEPVKPASGKVPGSV